MFPSLVFTLFRVRVIGGAARWCGARLESFEWDGIKSEEFADTHTTTIYTEAKINRKVAPNWP